jgi:hypothetical protein
LLTAQQFWLTHAALLRSPLESMKRTTGLGSWQHWERDV